MEKITAEVIPGVDIFELEPSDENQLYTWQLVYVCVWDVCVCVLQIQESTDFMWLKIQKNSAYIYSRGLPGQWEKKSLEAPRKGDSWELGGRTASQRQGRGSIGWGTVGGLTGGGQWLECKFLKAQKSAMSARMRNWGQSPEPMWKPRHTCIHPWS